MKIKVLFFRDSFNILIVFMPDNELILNVHGVVGLVFGNENSSSNEDRFVFFLLSYMILVDVNRNDALHIQLCTSVCLVSSS